ncbi:MAG: nickel transporter [Desulfamplus sp.]|nr:nickel transporter [Desulfamplus sp.]
MNENEMKNKLQILYEYEKHCLETIKTYKEEIKFVASMQEDLRRERSQFFTQTLKDVSLTLKQANVESETVSSWIKELVTSYTTSLDLSSDLAKTQITDILEQIKKTQQKEVNSVNIDSESITNTHQ